MGFMDFLGFIGQVYEFLSSDFPLVRIRCSFTSPTLIN